MSSNLITSIEAFIITFLSRRTVSSDSVVFEYPNRVIWDEKEQKITIDPNNLSKLRLNPYAKNTAQLLRVLDICYQHLVSDTWCTKRAMYYQDVNLFTNQLSIDKNLTILTRFFGVPRASLHVVASGKGLVSGEFSCLNTKGEIVLFEDKPSLIDPLIGNFDLFWTYAHFVLVVEDEATFKYLVELGVPRKNHCILVTGKGYPDYSTRLLLRRLEDLGVPILGLFDGDPHGLEILTSYVVGSVNSAQHNPETRISSMKWIGVFVEDIATYPISKRSYIPLTSADKKKIVCLQKKPWIQENIIWRTQLELIQSQDCKVEIQSLHDNGPKFLYEVYLKEKLASFHT